MSSKTRRPALRRLPLVLAVFLSFVFASSARAYNSAGDRSFPATILLPQIAPSDEVYFRGTTRRVPSGSEPGGTDRASNITGVFDKTITERLGVTLEGGYNWLDQSGGGPTLTGWQNWEALVQYLLVRDPEREFLFTLGLDREFGGTGARRIGADPHGATTPTLYFGKGFGDAGIELARPFALRGVFGYQLSDSAARVDQWQIGVALDYSIPYLQSKVRALDLPDFMRNLTPMVELLVTTPVRSAPGATTTTLVAPGFNYAGEGWELGVEALLPATRATGSGAGFTVQFHFALDYLFAGGFGMPLFGSR